MGSYRQHQSLLRELKEELEEEYEDVKTEILYHEGPPYDKNPLGELDIAAWNPGTLDIFEVKSNGAEGKASKQLKRAYDYFSNIFEEVRCYYYNQNHELKREF